MRAKYLDDSSGDFLKLMPAARQQILYATATVAPGTGTLELSHGSTAIAATIASAVNHQGLFIVRNTSASGTESHTLTLTVGTFNGTNNIATLDAPNEYLIVYFDRDGLGKVLKNVGSVALS